MVVDRRSHRVGLAVAVLALTFLHFALSPVFDSWYASPNLLVCAVLIAARELRPGTAATVGFALGLLEDAMAVSFFGLATLLLVLVGYIGSLTRDFFIGEERLFMGTYLFWGTWIYEAASFLLMGGGGDSLSYILLRMPLDALATGAVGYLVLPLVKVT
jgi:rod shape-determining protein MreD